MKIQGKQFLICYTGDELLLNTISSKISFLLNPLSKEGTCKVRNEIETKRNRTKRNEIKQNETKPIEMKRSEM
jgi:viroplasmin and RNaseH domain-containing protein